MKDWINPPKGQTLKFYANVILEWQQDVATFDIHLGRLRWLQGRALMYAKAKCKHGEWGPFLKSIGWEKGSADLCRKIAECVDEKKSLTLTYSAMLAIAYPDSFGKAAIERVTGSKSKRGKSDPAPQSFKSVLQTLKTATNSIQGVADKKFHDQGVEDYETAITSATALASELQKLIGKWKDRIGALRTIKQKAKAA